MSQGIVGNLLGKYQNSPFIRQLKARNLLFFYLIMMVLMPVVFAVLNIIQRKGVFSFMNIVMAGIYTGIIIGFLLLKWGHYNISANIITTICAAGLVSLVMQNAFAGQMNYISNVFYFPAIIIATSLFCSVAWLIGVSLVFFSVGIAAYFISTPSMPQHLVVLTNEIVGDYSIVIVFSFILCYLTVRVNRKSNDVAEEGLEKNSRQLEFIGGLLVSVREISGKVAGSSEEISSASSNFSDLAQSQAASAEEITSTIEEVSAGIDSVAGVVRKQSDMVHGLSLIHI